MAQPGYETEDLQPGDSNAKLSGQRARQGQNIKGMIWVLIIGVALVVIAYAVMLALQAEPSSVVNESANAAASAPVNSQGPSTPSDVQPQQTPTN
jgi:Trk-type K+ transport system membrane component